MTPLERHEQEMAQIVADKQALKVRALASWIALRAACARRTRRGALSTVPSKSSARKRPSLSPGSRRENRRLTCVRRSARFLPASRRRIRHDARRGVRSDTGRPDHGNSGRKEAQIPPDSSGGIPGARSPDKRR